MSPSPGGARLVRTHPPVHEARAQVGTDDDWEMIGGGFVIRWVQQGMGCGGYGGSCDSVTGRELGKGPTLQ